MKQLTYRVIGTRTLAVVTLMLVGAVSAQAEEHRLATAPPAVYPGCPVPGPTTGHIYRVGPSVTTNGAAKRMTLAQALAVARPSDVILLSGGDYGVVTIAGVNTSYITLAAESGQTPVLTQLNIGGRQPASGWRISGLKVIGPTDAGLAHDGWQLHPSKVNVWNSTDIVLQDNTVGTVDGDYKWQAEVQGSPEMDALASGFGVEGGSCVSILANHIHNVFNGMTIGGNQSDGSGTRFMVVGNTIDGFAGDGIDHYGSRITISHNEIINAHDICQDTCIHTDGIQGWNWHDKPGIVNTNIVIEDNTIISQARPDQPYPADDLHGITIFDGDWDGVDIINNVIVTHAWHGISVYGGVNIKIIDNSVVSNDPKRAAWIMVNHQKGPPKNVDTHDIVRNNVASAFLNGQGGHPPVAGVTEDHNVTLKDPAALFAVFDVQHARYDLHPSKRSALIGKGTMESAPPDDVDGRARVGTPTVGAYSAP